MTAPPSPSDAEAPAAPIGALATLLRILLLVELAGATAIAVWLHVDLQTGWVTAVALGAAAPLGTHAAIIAIDFAITTAAGSPTPAAHRLGPGAALALYARELIDSVRTFQLAQPLMAGRPLAGETVRPWSPGSPLPVLLVHGYFCNRQLWRPTARALAAQGHAIGAVDLEPVFGSIDAYAARIDDALRALMARTGAPAAHLLCHSMGGLAARAYLRRFGPQAVARVVTLGTPHQGTVLARLGHGVNTRQMRPGSDWLAALAAGEDAHTLGRFHVLLSHHDNIVAPQAPQSLPGAHTVEFSGMGHISLAYDAAVRRTVIGLLSPGARAGGEAAGAPEAGARPEAAGRPEASGSAA